ncbi:MAG: hypothetical protein COZ06_11775 [Armatimonadetes bacterium CG_4_10_14_3_um_filter_66_18]|nr:type II toxin-antitoxin system MqsA family antitoxin [Armatimonadota bacterium]OIP11152.1 MAG: hypothetical protein AUJ96_02830 [Armatimonadetes bacterium CG2_30_66_41]PIU91711.1 MAG: hypothetical protein COS65_21150 [Armatimonadetes bacterium CG06_land_8_20_14_3_00_66_21]PIX47993.1 MAG: hypothetical protein COZ57_06880 [Armatimonadetes bacterium CG_4_8_14_3_um_filter_66_20]PIY49984.1 MAG: hypothetical protein COZ06_11775 [Armatimonadetes bacterium CG_4_10_14_3_um_filter_66_18]PIZ44032.1 MA
MTRCANGCGSNRQEGETNPTFTRRGSNVEVTIYHVPAEICPVCGEDFLTAATAQAIDDLLEPFHGRGQRIPELPPARVLIEYPAAAGVGKAA